MRDKNSQTGNYRKGSGLEAEGRICGDVCWWRGQDLLSLEKGELQSGVARVQCDRQIWNMGPSADFSP